MKQKVLLVLFICIDPSNQINPERKYLHKYYGVYVPLAKSVELYFGAEIQTLMNENFANFSTNVLILWTVSPVFIDVTVQIDKR